MENTCEFTGGWTIQHILRRPMDIKESSKHMWIHRWMARSALHENIFGYQRFLEIPVNSQVDGSFSISWEDLRISKNLQNTCEFTGGWPIQHFMRRFIDINDFGKYQRIHKWMDHSAYLKKTHFYQTIIAPSMITCEFTGLHDFCWIARLNTSTK